MDQRVNYTQILLRGAVLKKYKNVLADWKETANGIAGYQWTLGKAKDVTIGAILDFVQINMERMWMGVITWA